MSLRAFSLAILFTSAVLAAPPGATPLSPAGPPKSVAPYVPANWKAGTATAKITPQKMLWMAGYAGRKKPAEGKVQDLFAKALALQDEQGNKLVFVTLDLIGVPQLLRQAVAQRAEKEFGLPSANLVMNASHTHSGPSLRTTPLTDADKDNPKARDAWDYTQKLQNDLVGLIGNALKEMQPARLTWNKARCGFAMNRRRDYTLPPDHPNANKAPNPDGPVDHEVPALRIEEPDGALRATLFGYACHNTSLGFYNWCGDYAGFAQEYLQEHRPGFTALFLMGCGADQNPYPRRSDVVPGVTDLELSMQHGRSLSNAVEMALVVNPRPVNGPIRAAYEEIKLSYAKAGRADHDYPVQVIKLGNDLTFITLGSEVVVY
ncbi:MAG: neutral/alkaline non-lysosomal ceramidase N-terminal domain-containing protein [Prosthecobacter sp.]